MKLLDNVKYRKNKQKKKTIIKYQVYNVMQLYNKLKKLIEIKL